MSREDSPLIVGDYWLDKRRDGKSPFWQITAYSDAARSNVYRSTKQRDVDAAGEVLRAYEAQQRSTAREQPADQAELLPHLFNYLREHGPDVGRLDTIKSSFRAWIGFLMQDELTTAARIADIDKNMVARFRRWRMGPHSWEIEWDGGKTYSHTSKGVSGKAVQRNIEDLRAALHHAEANHRFVAPKVLSIDKKLIQRNPRGTFTIPELGAILAYAKGGEDVGFYRELCLMLGSGCRPGHALAFDPAEQWFGDIMDLQPTRKDPTDKRAAVLPVIEPLKPILKAWKETPHDPVKSRKRTWRTLRRVLGVTLDAYSIRTTVSTYMDQQGVPGAQLSGIIGHLPSSRGIARTTSEHYLHYDPMNAKRAKAVLTQLFTAVQREAEKWAADHLRTTPLRGQPIRLALVASNG